MEGTAKEEIGLDAGDGIEYVLNIRTYVRKNERGNENMTQITVKEKGKEVTTYGKKEIELVILRIRDTDGSTYKYGTTDPEWARENLDVVETVSR